MQFVDQDVELLQTLVHFGGIDRFTTVGELFQFLRDVHEAFAEYSNGQNQIEARAELAKQTQGAVDNQRTKVGLIQRAKTGK